MEEATKGGVSAHMTQDELLAKLPDEDESVGDEDAEGEGLGEDKLDEASFEEQDWDDDGEGKDEA